GGGPTCDHHINIDELQAGAEAEIEVSDIATSKDADRSVGGKRLVVHAPVEANEIEGITQRLGPSQHEGIEQAHLGLGQGIERGEIVIEAGDAVVIEQQADTNTPLGSLAQLFQKDQAGRVTLPDVVLHVERDLGGADQGDPGNERLRP